MNFNKTFVFQLQLKVLFESIQIFNKMTIYSFHIPLIIIMIVNSYFNFNKFLNQYKSSH